MVAKLFSSNQYKWGDIIIIKIEDGIIYLKLNFFVLYIWYIKNNLIETNKYKKRYFERKPKAASMPNIIQLDVLSVLKLYQAKYTVPAQNGNWQTLTLNSGVVKL